MTASIPVDKLLVTDNFNVDWLFCPSDVFHLQTGYNLQTLFRIHPFAEKRKAVFIVSQKIHQSYEPMRHGDTKTIKHQDTEKSINELVEIDIKTNIFYFHIGNRSTAGCNNCLIKTPVYKWPQKYTFLLWVEWEPNLSTLTTYDSSANSPIIGKSVSYANSSNSLGCACKTGWQYLSNYKLVLNEWQFVVAVGGKSEEEIGESEGNRRTRLFVGDLSNVPKFLGEVNVDICGCDTYRIGHHRGGQGPGKVAFMKVVDNHLSEEQILDEYFQSMSSIMIQWTKIEYSEVLVVLEKYCGNINGIVNIVVEFCCGSWFLSNI